MEKNINSEQIDVKIKYVVILREYPYYILAHDEKSAIEYADRYQNICESIVFSPNGLQIKEIKKQTTLTDLKMRSIPQFTRQDDGIVEEIGGDELEELDDDELDVLDIDRVF